MPAPPFSTACISSPSREKSADNIDGAMSIVFPFTTSSDVPVANARDQRLLFGAGAGGRLFSFWFRLRFVFELLFPAPRLEFRVPGVRLPFVLRLPVFVLDVP